MYSVFRIFLTATSRGNFAANLSECSFSFSGTLISLINNKQIIACPHGLYGLDHAPKALNIGLPSSSCSA